MNIVVIGSGNVATHLAKSLHGTGCTILQVYSRNIAHARQLSERVDAKAINNFREITLSADFYIFSVSDGALPEILPQISQNKGTWLHTAGSIPMNIFEPYVQHFGVIYPLQTFSKHREINLSQVPFFIEGCSDKTVKKVELLIKRLSLKVQHLSSQKRKHLHLAAVFACNFVNHLYALSEKIVSEQEIDFNVLKPLIMETAEKVQSMSPREAQTGPAIRNDSTVIDKQIELLDDVNRKMIYRFLSESIYRLERGKTDVKLKKQK